MRSTVCWLAALAWFATAAAAAEGPRAHVTWQHAVGTTCPIGAALESDVEQLEGRDVFTTADDADVLVTGTIEELAGGVRIELEARRTSGELLGRRLLTAAAGQCASLRRPLAFVLTMLLDHDAQQPVPPVERPSLPRPPSHPLQLGAGVALLAGTLPRATAGISLAFGTSLTRQLRARADAFYWLPVELETDRGTGAQLQAFGVELALCPRLSKDRDRFAIWLCAGAQLGALSSAPRMLMGPARQTRLLAQAVAELKLSLRVLGPTWLELSLGPAISLARSQLWYARADGSRENALRPAAIGAILRLNFIIERP